MNRNPRDLSFLHLTRCFTAGSASAILAAVRGAPELEIGSRGRFGGWEAHRRCCASTAGTVVMETKAAVAGKRPIKSVYAEQAAAMIRVSRFRARSSRAFAAMLRDELGWGSLSRQAVYDWEVGRTSVPAAAVLAAAHLANVSVEELFESANRFRSPGIALAAMQPSRPRS